MHAVERVRHVDEAALAPDLGDRLGQGHPAGDLLLDEEADHLALVRRLHLLGDDHLDAVVLGHVARGVGAGDDVVVGHRDRAEADVTRGLEQSFDRGRAIVGVVGVHVQVHVDQLARAQPLPQSRVALAVPQPGDAVVDPAKAAAGAPTRARRLLRPRVPPGPPAARVSSTKRASWAASVSESRGMKSSPSSPSCRISSYSGSREATGTAPETRIRVSICSEGEVPSEAATATWARGQLLLGVPSRAPVKRTRSRIARASGGVGWIGSPGDQTVARHGRVAGSFRSARRKSRSAGRSSSTRKTMSMMPSSDRAGATGVPRRAGPPRSCWGRSGRAAWLRPGSWPSCRRAVRRRARTPSVRPGWRPRARRSSGSCPR